VPLGRWGTPDDIANAVAFLASERAAFIAGTNIDVDGGHQRSIF
jgi:3-oxoacyl-[acyl-carrier protein] reductase